MESVYRPNPAAQWRYSRSRPFVPQNIAATQTIFEQIPTWLFHHTRRRPWIYEVDQDVQWHYYGRAYFTPLGAPVVTAIEAPAGHFMVSGKIPEILVAQPTGTHKPHILPYLVPVSGGVYRTAFHLHYRISVISEATAAAISGVEIQAPAGVITFTGQVHNLGDTIIQAVRGSFVMVGQFVTTLSVSLGVVIARRGERTVALFQRQKTVKTSLPGDTTVRGGPE